MLSVDEQMRIITSGAAQIVPEADLRKKLEKGEPLNIKLGVDPTWATTSPLSSATALR